MCAVPFKSLVSVRLFCKLKTVISQDAFEKDSKDIINYQRFGFQINAVVLNFLLLNNQEKNDHGFHKIIKHKCFQHGK